MEFVVLTGHKIKTFRRSESNANPFFNTRLTHQQKPVTPPLWPPPPQKPTAAMRVPAPDGSLAMAGLGHCRPQPTTAEEEVDLLRVYFILTAIGARQGNSLKLSSW